MPPRTLPYPKIKICNDWSHITPEDLEQVSFQIDGIKWLSEYKTKFAEEETEPLPQATFNAYPTRSDIWKTTINLLHELYPSATFYDGTPIPFLEHDETIICIDNLGVEQAPDIVIRYFNVNLSRETMAELVEDSECWKAINTAIGGYRSYVADGELTNRITAQLSSTLVQMANGAFSNVCFKIKTIDFLTPVPTYDNVVVATIEVSQAKPDCPYPTVVIG